MDVIIPLLLLVTAYFTGRGMERAHFRSIRRREQASKRMPIITSRTIDPTKTVERAGLVTGHVVVSTDYFKRFLASLRNIFGGRVKSYETMLDRGRRESILRMKAAALHMGANMVINVRMETSAIGKQGPQNKGLGAIEVLAYGTALKVR